MSKTKNMSASLGLRPFSGNISETIFHLFLSILHYFREYLLKIGDNSAPSL